MRRPGRSNPRCARPGHRPRTGIAGADLRTRCRTLALLQGGLTPAPRPAPKGRRGSCCRSAGPNPAVHGPSAGALHQNTGSDPVYAVPERGFEPWGGSQQGRAPQGGAPQGDRYVHCRLPLRQSLPLALLGSHVAAGVRPPLLDAPRHSARRRGLPPRCLHTRGGLTAVARVRTSWAGIRQDPHSVPGPPGSLAPRTLAPRTLASRTLASRTLATVTGNAASGDATPTATSSPRSGTRIPRCERRSSPESGRVAAWSRSCSGMRRGWAG